MQTVTINQRVLAAVGLGTWHMGDDPAKRTMEIQALQAGIKAGAQVIDTAEMYGNGRAERLVAEAIKPFDRQYLFLSLTRSCHSTRATRSWSRVWIAV